MLDELPDQSAYRHFADFVRPAILSNGTEPESRLLVCGISWQRYLEIDRLLGDDRPSPRLYFLNGNLEFVSGSEEHERLKKRLAGFLEEHLYQQRIEVYFRGQATIRFHEEAAAEPCDSWCLRTKKQFPDLILEIELSQGGIPKLELYHRFAVLEVWIWRNDHLEMYGMSDDGGGYEPLGDSKLVPAFDTKLAEECTRIESWLEARRRFREGLSGRARSKTPR